MKQKGEVLQKFQHFKALVENQTGQKIKVLQSDNGGEYTGKAFQEFCSDHGIERRFSAPYAPNQNGRAERLNRTLIEMVTSMMSTSKLPNYLWGEALLTAAYLKNLSPHSSIEGKTPEEAWSGKKPSVRHLKAFGCKTSTLLTPSKSSKFSSRVWMGSFVGYGGKSFGYRIWDPVKKQIFMRKDVKFYEDDILTHSNEKTDAQHSNTTAFVVDFLDAPNAIDVSTDFSSFEARREDRAEGAAVEEASQDQTVVREEQPPLRRSSRVRRQVNPLQRFGQLHHTACVGDIC
jgi:hypothetical protein